MSQIGKRVQFARDCEVVQIPAGHRLTIPRGTDAAITQSLGGTFTLEVASLGALAREPIATERPVPSEAAGDLERQVWDALKTCYDPEIPVNIVDLGLVY